MRKFVSILPILIIILSIVGCSTFEVRVDPETNDWTVTDIGAPLINKKDVWEVTHTWLDSANVLHEIKVTRNNQDNASQQVEMIKLIESLTVGTGAAGKLVK